MPQTWHGHLLKKVLPSSIVDFKARMEALAKEKIEHSFRGGQKFWCIRIGPSTMKLSNIHRCITISCREMIKCTTGSLYSP